MKCQGHIIISAIYGKALNKYAAEPYSGGIRVNTAELKSHFYKRFIGENGRMTLSEAGLPCSLLGYINTEHMPSVGCAMSMSVKIIARKIGSGTVIITSTETDMCRAYPIDNCDGRDRISVFLNRARDFGINGTQILCDNSIPGCFNMNSAYTAAVAKALLELSKRGVPRPETSAALCAQRDELNEYLTVFASRKGYCVYAQNGSARIMPLPMTGYKFLLINPRQSEPPVTARLINRTYMLMKELYPHITSFADVSPEMLDIAAPRLRPKEVRLCAKHMADECRRVSAGARALVRCNIRAFAEIMRESCYSQKRICQYNDENVFLADELLDAGGVLGVRMCERGVMAIVDENRCDEVVKSIRFAYENEFGAPPVFCIADGI